MSGEEIFEIFKADAQEHLQLVEGLLLQLEKGGEVEEGVLDEILRALHTLKGDSKMVGLEEVGRLAHRAEDVFKEIKAGRLELEGVLGVVFDTLVLLRALIFEPSVEGAEVEKQMQALDGVLASVSSGGLGQKLSGILGAVPSLGGDSSLEAREERREGEASREDLEESILFIEKAFLELEADLFALIELLDDILDRLSLLCEGSRGLGLEGSLRVAELMVEIFCAFKSGEAVLDKEILGVLLEGISLIRSEVLEEVVDFEEVERVVGLLKGVMSSSLSDRVREEERTKVRRRRPSSVVGSSQKSGEESSTKVSGEGREEKVGETDPVVRVRSSYLDNILNLVGELTINREKITSLYFQLRNTLFPLLYSEVVDKEQKAHLEELLEKFYEFCGEYYQLTNEIQGETLEMRMLPFSTIAREYPLMVRRFAKELGKEIEFVVSGEDTRLDKQLLEPLRGALTHMIRNSIDHGIESPEERMAMGKAPRGTVCLRAYPKGNHIMVEVEDDGRGLNLEKIRQRALEKRILSSHQMESLSRSEVYNLIFAPGFSTKQFITDLSGRGVGMDVVMTTVKRLKGHIHIETQEDFFTRFTIQLPMSLSMTQALLVEVYGELVAIPLSFVLETQVIYPEQVRREGSMLVFKLRGSYVPLVHLGKLLRFSSGSEGSLGGKKWFVVVLKWQKELVGVVVDRFLRQQEIVIKGIGEFLDNLAFVSGATVLRKGDAAIILNVYDVFDRLQSGSIFSKDLELSAGSSKRPLEILVVDDSLTVRTVQKSVLEEAGYRVQTCGSAEEALELAREKVYDLVVTDVQMGEMDGFELTRILRQDPHYADVPIVIVTSLAKPEDRQRGLEVGAQAYIVKSNYDQKVLLETIRSLIGEGRC